MMNEKIVRALVDEMLEEKKKAVRIPVYYKRKGQMIRRSYDDIKYTDRYAELLHLISNEKAFTCPNCGKKVTYFELCEGMCEECWGEDL